MVDVCSMNIITVEHDGGVAEVTLRGGASLLKLLQEHDVEVAAVCGGSVSCATCHVYLTADQYAAIAPPSEGERELLEDSDGFRAGSSRLACQIDASTLQGGTTIIVVPDD
jgi:2Fe-2S ferredoxin